MAGAVTLCRVGLNTIGGAMMMQNGHQANAATAVSVPTRRSTAPTLACSSRTGATHPACRSRRRTAR